MHHSRNMMVFKTQLGWAGVAISGRRISRIVLPKRLKKTVERELYSSELEVRSSGQSKSSKSLLLKSRKALEKFFSGRPVSFDLPLDLRYYTSFQQAVWKAAAKIPYGETRSYAWVAKSIGNPKAVRAVGQAMGANPFPIIVP